MPADLRISTPEIYYEQLEEPHTSQISIARLGLIKVLDLRPQKGFRHVGWHDISEVMIENGTTLPEKRDLLGISTRIVGLMRNYPWLQGFMRYGVGNSPISVKDLDVWSGNHVFDDYLGLFGITNHESHVFRGVFHGGSDPGHAEEVVRELRIEQ